MRSPCQASRRACTAAAVLLLVAALPLHARPAGAQDAGWPADPLASKLLLGPTARSLAPGAGHAGVYEVLLPVVVLGVVERVSLLAASPLVPSEGKRPVFLSPKVELLRSGGVSGALGVMAILGPDDLDAPLAMGFAVATAGGEDRAVSVGAATGLADRSGAEARGVLWMLGGEMRTGRRTKLLTENYSTFDGESTLLTAGLRHFAGRLAVEAGAALFLSEDETTPLPILNLAYTFGRRR